MENDNRETMMGIDVNQINGLHDQLLQMTLYQEASLKESIKRNRILARRTVRQERIRKVFSKLRQHKSLQGASLLVVQDDGLPLHRALLTKRFWANQWLLLCLTFLRILGKSITKTVLVTKDPRSFL
jgi:hypothetical protein